MAAIIFDLDGTIADSFEFVADFLAEKQQGQHLDSREKHQLYGLSMYGMARQLGFPWWRLLRLLFEGRKQMGEVMTEIDVFSGVPEVIRKIHAEGHELFIVSSNTSQNIHKFLHHHELNSHFLAVYGGAGFSKAKSIRKLLKDQNIHHKNAIYVGDEVRDIKAAHAVDMKVVAVSWGFASPENLRRHRPNAIVNTPSELLAVLEDV